jgi:hypothetical protein
VGLGGEATDRLFDPFSMGKIGVFQ